MNVKRGLWSLSLLMTGFPLAHAVENAPDTSPVIATIGDKTFTEAQMRKDLAFSLYEAENNIYMMKKSWIDQKTQDFVFEKAAKDAKLSRAEWEKKEIDGKITPPTDQEIDLMIQGMARGQTVTPEMKTQAMQYAMNQRRSARLNTVYTELSRATPVQISLLPPPPPDVQITYSKDNPVKGPKDAPVTIIEFTDFQCPWCSRSQESLKAVETAFPGKVKVVTRHFPLTQIHPNALPSAKMAVCAQQQGKFWEMHDKLFANQNALAESNLKAYAKELGLNMSKLDKCLTSANTQKIIDADMADAQRYGVRGTPTFFVNNMKANFNQLTEMVKAELDKKK